MYPHVGSFVNTLSWGVHETRWPGVWRGLVGSLHRLRRGVSTNPRSSNLAGFGRFWPLRLFRSVSLTPLELGTHQDSVGATNGNQKVFGPHHPGQGRRVEALHGRRRWRTKQPSPGHQFLAGMGRSRLTQGSRNDLHCRVVGHAAGARDPTLAPQGRFGLVDEPGTQFLPVTIAVEHPLEVFVGGGFIEHGRLDLGEAPHRCGDPWAGPPLALPPVAFGVPPMARSLVVLVAGQAVLDGGEAGFVVDLDNVGGPTKGGGGGPDADARFDIGSAQFFDRRRGPLFQAAERAR